MRVLHAIWSRLHNAPEPTQVLWEGSDLDKNISLTSVNLVFGFTPVPPAFVLSPYSIPDGLLRAGDEFSTTRASLRVPSKCVEDHTSFFRSLEILVGVYSLPRATSLPHHFLVSLVGYIDATSVYVCN